MMNALNFINMKIGLSISDEGGNLITRYYIRGVKNLQDIVDLLTIPLNLSQKLVLVNALRIDKDDRYLRGMYDYNQQVIGAGINAPQFDLLVVNHNTMPRIDFNMSISIRKKKLYLVISIAGYEDHTPIWDGDLRKFKIKYIPDQFQHYFIDNGK